MSSLLCGHLWRGKSRRRIFLNTLATVMFVIGAHAQGPDYSNVKDFLNGRRTLLAVDDIVVGAVDAVGSVYTSTSTSTKARLNPGNSSSFCCRPSGVVVKTLQGRMFNLASSTTVELLSQAGFSSEIEMPFLSEGGDAEIDIAPGVVDGAMADFNGDGYDDLVLTFTGGKIEVATARNVNIKTSDDPELDFGPMSTLDPLTHITVGDFNGDGRPEIAGLVQLPSGGLKVVIYTVDPKSLAVSKAGELTLQKPELSTLAAVSIARGRFTPAAHDQIVVAYIPSGLNTTTMEAVDFASGSLDPVEKTNYTFKGGFLGKGGVMKVETGKFGLPANPYNQVVLFVAPRGPNPKYADKYLVILRIDPDTLNWNAGQYQAYGDDCGFDMSVGNFDNREPDLTKPGQTQHNFNDQIALLLGTCGTGQKKTVVITAGPDAANPDIFIPLYISEQNIPAALDGVTSLTFAASDTQGRSMILGAPTKITLNSTIQPSVVVGVPPMHVDFISPDLGRTAPQVLNISAVPDGFKTTYQQESSITHKSGTTNVTSWSFGAEESANASLTIGDPDEGEGLRASDTLTAAQSLKGAAQQDYGTSQRQTFDLSATTGLGDEVFFISSDYNVWVYPVIGKTVCPAGKSNCQSSERRPLTVQFSAPNGDALPQPSQGQLLQWYQPPWEPGNIFSYPANKAQLERIYPNLVTLTNDAAFPIDSSTITEYTSWSVTKKTSASTSFKQNYSFENDYSFTGAIGLEGIISAEAGYSVDLSGSVGLSRLTKSTTDLGESTGVQVSKSGASASPPQKYAYLVSPYLMGTAKPLWSVDSQPLSTDIQTFGLLRAMYTADPLASNAGAWWLEAYRQAPDVALNHPSRWQITTPALTNPIPPNCLATGTGVSQMDCATLNQREPNDPWQSYFHEMRGFFISNAASPGKGPQLQQAKAGDVLTLQARVYNYSLAAMPTDSKVHVRFYFMPWNQTVPAGDSVLIGEEELSPIPPFNDDLNGPLNWVLASTTFDTGKYDQTRNGASVVFWVVVWMQAPDGKLVPEMPGHGFTAIPGALKSLADAPEECQSDNNCYSNNVGLYHQIFEITPPGSALVGAASGTGPPYVDITNANVSATRVNPSTTVVVSATLLATDKDVSSVSANFYDGNPQQGGRLFDVEQIPRLPQTDPYRVQAPFRGNVCGTHNLFVLVNQGKSSEVTRQVPQVTVDCGS